MKNKRGITIKRVVITVYLIGLFVLLFMKSPIGSHRSLNIVPFDTIRSFVRYLRDNPENTFIRTNLWGNAVLFLPLGIIISGHLPKKHNIFLTTILVMLLSLLAECLQYVLYVGAADIDDVILNTLGGFAGAVIYQIFLLVFKRENK